MANNKRVLLRLPQNLYDIIENRASQNLRSVNSEMIILLKLGLVNQVDEAQSLKAASKLMSEADDAGKTTS